MNKRIFFGWSNDTVIITTVFGIITIAVLIYLFKTISFKDPIGIWGVKMAAALIIIASDIYMATTTPVFLIYNESELRIKMVLGSKKIPYIEIVDIQNIEPSVISKSTRRFGSGGAGGYTGLFYNKVLGNYYIYATEKRNLVLIESKTKKYVFNCYERDDLVAFVKSKTEK
ncbi:MAG: PH domain-containing protein [Rikenellaceae bacterium]|nr:PH domain-containing protein [Rikenellaceae bacterium]